jgi:hypothetical protein
LVSKIHTGSTPARFENSCIENIDRLGTSFGTSIEISIETYNVRAGRPGLRKKKNMRLFGAHDSELFLSVFAPFPVRYSRTFLQLLRQRSAEIL